MILALVIVACVLFLIAAIMKLPTVPDCLIAAGLFFWALSTVWGHL